MIGMLETENVSHAGISEAKSESHFYFFNKHA